MKKITFLLVALTFCFSWQGFAQITSTCGETVTGLCYSEVSTQEVLLNFSAGAGEWAELVFIAGGAETCCDEVVVFDGLDGTGNIIYGALSGGSLSDYSGEDPVVSTTGLLSLVINSDSSWTCASQGYTPFEVTTNCVAPPSCQEPSGMTAASVTDTTADLTWTASASGETAWNLEWKAGADFTPGNSEEDDSTSVTTAAAYTATNLMSNTTYYIYYQADCGGGDTSAWVGPFVGTTLCGTYTPDYTENFDTYIPDCWEEATGPITGPTAFGSAGWANDGFGNNGSTGSARFNIYSTGGDDWLLTPIFDLTGGGFEINLDVALTQYAATTAGTIEADDAVYVMQSVDGGTTWTTIYTWDNANSPSNTGDNVAIDISAVTSATTQFGVFALEGATSGGDLDFFVDNFKVRTPPSCLEPSNLTLDTVTQTTADVSWTIGDSETDWDLVYGSPGLDPDTEGTLIDVSTTTSYTITGLTENTSYEVYVRADCGGSTSVWVGPISVSTLCNAFGIPFTEGFNSDSTTQNCWTVLNENGDSDSWNMDYTTTPYEGDESAMMYTDFNSGNNDDWLISPGITLTGAERLKFQTRVQSSGEPNDFEVLLSTTGTTPADFTTTLLASAEYSNTTYQEFAIDLTAYSGIVYLAWHIPNGGLDGWRLYIDEVVVEVQPTDTPDWYNIQWINNNDIIDPPTGSNTSLTVDAFTSVTVYAQVYEAGLTDPVGQATGIECWIGGSGTDSDPSTWANDDWEAISYFGDSGNNDEYSFDAVLDFTGTVYIAIRWRLNGGPYVYGGNNGPWDGTASNNIELISNPLFANDDCAGAIALTVNADLACGAVTPGTTVDAAQSQSDDSSCSGNNNDDVWFSFVATSETHAIEISNVVAVSGTSTDMYFEVLEGSCGNLASLLCSDNNTNSVSGLTIGNTYLVRVYSYYDTASQTFDLCVGTPPPPPANDECSGAESLAFGILTAGTTISATGASSTSCNGSIGNDVWYTFIGDGGDITITVDGETEDMQIGVFEDTDCSGIVLGSCDYSIDPFANPAVLNFTSIDGAVYYVQVGIWINSASYDDTNFNITIDSTLSLGDFEQNSFTYFPNPVTNNLTLRAQYNIQNVSVLNMLGQEVMQVTPNAMSSDINMAGLSAGAYFVKVTIDNTTETIRIIKK